MPDDTSEQFDAVAAAKELDDLLGDRGGDSSYVAGLEAEAAELNALVAKKDAELQKANVRANQAHAEIEAASKRLANAAQKDLERRTRAILESFLPVLDDLDRGITAARQIAESVDVVTGLELVRRGMLSRFAQLGVTHAPALGEVFDPNRHEALALVPVRDPAQDGRVIDVMREGYMIGEQTLRPAGVAVGKRT
jgi:molecular chaperone GrpE